MNKDKLILVGCEFSQTVTKAFQELGFKNTFSCDIEEQTGGHPEWHLKMDIFDAINSRQWDLAIFHPPCFSKDTLVLTKNGYKEIGDICIGEEVLTHKQRWKKVTNVMKHWSGSTLNLSITGSNKIITTDEHPFYSKLRTWKSVRNGKIISNIKSESEPTWINAKQLEKGHLIGGLLPPLNNSNEHISNEHLWLMGLYVADGHLRFRNDNYEGVFFSIGKHQYKDFQKIIQTKHTEYTMGSVSRICMYGKDFCRTFAQFGRGAKNKNLPGWILSLPKERAKIFLDGYLFGDGYITNKNITSSSISKKLTTSIALLMRRVYERSSSINFSKRKPTTIIENRVVNQNNSYVALISNKKGTKSIATIDGDFVWNCFRKSEIGKGMMVYNLSVEEDESYMVDQCLVHNCTRLTVTGNKWYRPEYADRFPTIHEDREKAVEFFMKLYNCDIQRVCIENPIGIMSTRFRKPDQIIQPWQHGHETQKSTCLWLKNLPLITPTNIVDKGKFFTYKSGKRIPLWYHNAAHNDPLVRAKIRNTTFEGIAQAFATQWGQEL